KILITAIWECLAVFLISRPTSSVFIPGLRLAAAIRQTLLSPIYETFWNADRPAAIYGRRTAIVSTPSRPFRARMDSAGAPAAARWIPGDFLLLLPPTATMQTGPG